MGYKVVQTKSPGYKGDKLCQNIRELLLSPDSQINNPYTELFLYLADQAQHFNSLKDEILSLDTIVLCDRFTDSTIAYQGYGRGLDIELIEKLNWLSVPVVPDLTLLFYIDPVVALERNKDKTKDRLESVGIEFFERVNHGYCDLMNKNIQRWTLIPAHHSEEFVSKRVLSEILEVL